jgi:heme-degrading monooxygenase HmoA
MIVHLLEFRVVPGHGPELAAVLRRFPSDTNDLPGLVGQCVGRRLGRQQLEHIVVTVWEDEAAFQRGVESNGLPAVMAAYSDLLSNASWSAFEAHSQSIANTFADARILRVYRASVEAGAVDQWLARAESQAVTLAEKAGLKAVMVGTRLPAVPEAGNLPVIAVSAWRDWNSVLMATGGHIDQLVIETELDELEHPISVDHYQLAEPEPHPAGVVEPG